MPRTYLIFGDIEGKLDVLNVEFTNCARKGRYHILRLIEVYGRKGSAEGVMMAPRQAAQENACLR